ncbi:MFS 1 domain containing protein [Trichuris trichiura]|uniref:MFS 1 domain containing protein n=1 Tax=Trichuris trichiura TaxID=36087 RepID=A0A077Z732_TRITR|nr:MFS 1 domain containing protein [Trichuris trichiura]
MPKAIKENIDGGWAWVVTAASLLTNVLVDGVLFTSGHVLQPVWSEYFEVGAGEAAVPIAMMIAVYMMAGPFASSMADKYGSKLVAKLGSIITVLSLFFSAAVNSIIGLSVTFGIFAGLGYSFLSMASVSVIGEYFEMKRSLAAGIAVSGSGFGIFLFAPLMLHLTQNYTWNVALVVLAIMMFLTFVFALLYEPVNAAVIKNYPHDISDSVRETVQVVRRISCDMKSRISSRRNKESGTDSSSLKGSRSKDSAFQRRKKKIYKIYDFSRLKGPTFTLFCFSTYFSLMGLLVPYIFLPQQARAKGISETGGTMLISYMGFFNILVRLACMYAYENFKVDTLSLTNCCLIVAGFFTLALPNFASYWMFIIFALFFSVGTGVFFTLRTASCRELCGQSDLPRSYGVVMLFMGVAVFIGIPLAGAFYDLTGNWNLTFYIAGLFIMFSGFIAWPIKGVKQWEIKRKIMKFISLERSANESSESSDSGRSLEGSFAELRKKKPKCVHRLENDLSSLLKLHSPRAYENQMTKGMSTPKSPKSMKSPKFWHGSKSPKKLKSPQCRTARSSKSDEDFGNTTSSSSKDGVKVEVFKVINTSEKSEQQKEGNNANEKTSGKEGFLAWAKGRN